MGFWTDIWSHVVYAIEAVWLTATLLYAGIYLLFFVFVPIKLNIERGISALRSELVRQGVEPEYASRIADTLYSPVKYLFSVRTISSLVSELRRDRR